MRDEERKQQEVRQERDTDSKSLRMQDLMEELEETKKKLDISNQQITAYQELQKLQEEAVYRYNHLQVLQQQNLSLKGIGQALVEIGKVMDKTSSVAVNEDVDNDSDDEEPEEDVDEEEEEYVPRKKRK